MPDSQPTGIVPPQERRRSRRFPCDLEIGIEWGAALLRGAVKEISAEGMFVALDGPLWVGARFAAQLALDGPVALDCVVCRVEPRRGMGLMYTPSQESGRVVVSALLERLTLQ